MYTSKTAEKICAELRTDIRTGLTEKEACERRLRYGPNAITEQKRKSVPARFFAQFSDFMTLVLIAASVISYITSAAAGSADITEPLIILAIVFLNAVMGTVQELRAERSLAELKKLSSPHAVVIRSGRKVVIPSEEVTVGDILVLKTGDIISADGRLFECRSMYTDESALTGESISTEKSAEPIRGGNLHPGDMRNMVFASTAVTGGSGRAIVTSVGMSTETGSIAGLLSSDEDEKTPLQRRLDRTGSVLGVSALIICALIFAIGIFRGLPFLEMLMTSVSLAVAAIPEGLSAVVTVILAMGVARMARRSAVVRTLSATEALGSATVICTDKTGTLTENKLSVSEYMGEAGRLLEYAALCTDADNLNSTDIAVLEAAKLHGVKKTAAPDMIIPFSSETKLMEVRAGGMRVIKGAPEKVLERCTRTDAEGRSKPLSSAGKQAIADKVSAAAKRALRAVAVARSENGAMVFSGIIYLEDRIRPEAEKAVKVCAEAGIRTVMVTGDHPATAEAVAKKAGILAGGGSVMTGAELDAADDARLDALIDNVRVFARVTPSHKARIVKAYRRKGETVAMTGDGVNDAPSLKLADIGCSMGKNGTEVAKSASDIILADDNFATIAEAVRLGRGIYDNIRKAVRFLLSSNIGEIMTMFSCLVMGWQTPLLPIQLLWVNLVTDSLPAVALGLDPIDPAIMKRRPIGKNEPLFKMSDMLTEGVMIGALALAAFSAGRYRYGIETARTLTFTVLAVSQLFHAFNMRSEGSVFKAGVLKNKYLDASLVIGLIMQAAAVTVPKASALFGTAALSAGQWTFAMALSVMPVVIMELQKAINSRRA